MSQTFERRVLFSSSAMRQEWRDRRHDITRRTPRHQWNPSPWSEL